MKSTRNLVMNWAALMVIMLSLMTLTATSAGAQVMTCIIKDTQYVRVRAMATKNSSEIGRLHYGDKIDTIRMDNGFYQFDFNGQTGYARMEYFEIECLHEKYVVVANGRVAKRTKPNGKNAGWLNPGIKIEVLGWRYDDDGKKWARVYGNYFVKADYLSAVTDVGEK